MLAVVSAVVAFDRWPGARGQNPLKTLVLEEKAPAIRVSATSNGPSATPGRTAGRVPLAVRVPRTTFDGGGVAGQRFTSPSTGVTAPSVPTLPPVLPNPPAVPTPDTVIESISNPDTTAGQIADGAQAVTDAAGVSLARVSPDAGNTVAVGGQQASQAVRDLPLPDHLVPGR